MPSAFRTSTARCPRCRPKPIQTMPRTLIRFVTVAMSLAPLTAAAAPPVPTQTKAPEAPSVQAQAAPSAPASAAPKAPAALEPEPSAASKDRRGAKLGLRFSGYVQAQYDRSQLSASQIDANGDPLNY